MGFRKPFDQLSAAEQITSGNTSDVLTFGGLISSNQLLVLSDRSGTALTGTTVMTGQRTHSTPRSEQCDVGRCRSERRTPPTRSTSPALI